VRTIPRRELRGRKANNFEKREEAFGLELSLPATQALWSNPDGDKRGQEHRVRDSCCPQANVEIKILAEGEYFSCAKPADAKTDFAAKRTGGRKNNLLDRKAD
jgi:hypothetical protein